MHARSCNKVKPCSKACIRACKMMSLLHTKYMYGHHHLPRPPPHTHTHSTCICPRPPIACIDILITDRLLYRVPPLFQILWFLVLARPSPLAGIFDYYIFDTISNSVSLRLGTADFHVRSVLGGGNFGTAYEGVRIKVCCLCVCVCVCAYETVARATPSCRARKGQPPLCGTCTYVGTVTCRARPVQCFKATCSSVGHRAVARLHVRLLHSCIHRMAVACLMAVA